MFSPNSKVQQCINLSFDIITIYYNVNSILKFSKLFIQLILEDCCDLTLASTGLVNDHTPNILGTYTKNGRVNNKPVFKKDDFDRNEERYLFFSLQGFWMVDIN